MLEPTVDRFRGSVGCAWPLISKTTVVMGPPSFETSGSRSTPPPFLGAGVRDVAVNDAAAQVARVEADVLVNRGASLETNSL